MYLPLCILLISAAKCQIDHTSPLDQTINFHCGTSDCTADASDALSANIELRLEGAGFHRRLHYTIDLTCLDDIIPRPSRAVILQPLPAAIYANIYELDADTLAGNGPEVRLFGDVDVESIEKFAHPTTLAIYQSLATSPENVQGTTTCGIFNISIPLHGRYPRAILNSNKTNLGFKELLKGLFVDIKLQMPIVLVQTSTTKSEIKERWLRVKFSEKNNHQLQRDSIVWSLPAGNMHWQSISAAITAAVVCISAGAVLHSLFFNSSRVNVSQRKKRM